MTHTLPRPLHAAAAALAALLGIAPAAHAQAAPNDGVTTIHQDAVLAGGITPDDGAGFPVTISKSGTYRLTSNLIVPAGMDGLHIIANVDATIDLNGFQIVGAAVCSKAQNCFDHMGTAGVRATSTVAQMTVLNGRIRGFNYAGIAGYQTQNTILYNGNAMVDNVRVQDNGYGIRVLNLIGSRIVAEGNSIAGIMANQGTVSDARAISNGGDGVYLGAGSVRNSYARSNGSYGFRGSAGYTVFHHNAATLNAKGGVFGGLPVTGTNGF